jgi:hypothetical protein
MSEDETRNSIERALLERFGEKVAVDPGLSGLNELAKIVGHRSHRQYSPRPIERLLRAYFALVHFRRPQRAISSSATLSSSATWQHVRCKTPVERSIS